MDHLRSYINTPQKAEGPTGAPPVVLSIVVQLYCAWTLFTENAEFNPWQAEQLSPIADVFARACALAASEVWQLVQAAVSGPSGLTGPLGSNTFFAVSGSGSCCELLTWHIVQFCRLPGKPTSLKPIAVPPNPKIEYGSVNS